MKKNVIYTSKAPDPIGPYSQAIYAGNTLYVSGQIGIDPDSGKISQSDIETETRQVMSNLGEILKAANLTFLNVVKCSIFVRRMEDFSRINQVYGTFFSQDPPARETVEVSQLPKGVNVEISCIAVAL
ncbi:MAG: RidA family protein [Candidatus Cyclobacteriaceae bacterium M3_2C_046]